MRGVQVQHIVATALRVRRRLGARLTEPVCPYEIARGLGLSVRCVSVPSLEGLYRPGDTPVIILGSQRPWGRRNYTCAHEIGHHVFGHGARLDEVQPVKRRWSPEEYMADRFAAAILMPKLSVLEGFTCRRIDARSPAPLEVALIAEELGVGFGTLVSYMERTLQILSAPTAKQLRRKPPKLLRRELLGEYCEHQGRLVVVDSLWRRSTVDLDVGDVVLPPPGTKAECLALSHGPIPGAFLACSPGSDRLKLPERAFPLDVRVSRRWFHGLAKYRFLEEEDE